MVWCEPPTAGARTVGAAQALASTFLHFRTFSFPPHPATRPAVSKLGADIFEMPQPVAGKPRCAFVTPERGEKGTICLVDAGILRKDFLKILFTPLGGTRTGVVLSPAKSCSTGSGCGIRTVRRAEAWDYFASACSRLASVGDFPGEADGCPGEATFVEGEASAAGVERVAPRARPQRCTHTVHSTPKRARSDAFHRASRSAHVIPCVHPLAGPALADKPVWHRTRLRNPDGPVR